jgi:manganese efflux pump family protein
MEWAALITWLLTAGGGFVLLLIWVSRGGMSRKEPGSRIRPPLILSHFLLAATGLVLWIVYVFSDADALAWIAFVLLLVVALLGFTMFAIWLRRRRGETAVEPAPPAEQHFPVAIVGLHGALAVVTVILVFLATIGG